jgi:hypothetical protein
MTVAFMTFDEGSTVFARFSPIRTLLYTNDCFYEVSRLSSLSPFLLSAFLPVARARRVMVISRPLD